MKSISLAAAALFGLVFSPPTQSAEDPSPPPSYYAALQARCESGGGKCCFASVERMQKNGFSEAQEGGRCPAGQQANTLRCPGALTWCEPQPQGAVLEGNPELYLRLRKSCEANPKSRDCCLRSVEEMERDGGEPVPPYGCPPDTALVQAKCPGAIGYCKPSRNPSGTGDTKGVLLR
jgi:hypothetical protein